MLKLAREALEAVRAHAENGYPLEICGFLLGRAEGETRVVSEAWPVRNVWAEDPEARGRLLEGLPAGDPERWIAASAERRYLASPREQLEAMKRARAAGLDVVGVYHTHPNHPAVPSEFDREAAWPGWSYLILSVRDGQVAEVRSWVLNEAASRFEEEPVETEPAGLGD